ncbi:hypothetical protein ACJJTC_012370 [Scirpophaga incertulas]
MIHQTLPASPSLLTTTTREKTSPKTNWEKIRKDAIQNYALDQMGLSSLTQRANAESDGETDEEDDTQMEVEAETDWETKTKAWEKEYLPLVRIQKAAIVQLKNFMRDLTNSSLRITETEDYTGTSCTLDSINSRDLTTVSREVGTLRLGRTIRAGTYKNKSVDCLHCLREYLYSGNGRQVLHDIVGKEHIEISRDHGIVDATAEADVSGTGTDEHQVYGKKWKILDGREDGPNNNNAGIYFEIDNRNADIILLLCERGAFTEAEAMGVFAKSPEGINLMCTKQYNEKISNWIHIARVLVFQESLKQRFERAKKKFEELKY